MFIREWNQFVQDIRGFFKTRRWLVALVGVTVCLVYGIRLVSEDLSIDTELMLNDQGEVLGSWLGTGRFGLVLTKKLFGFLCLVPFTENLMMMVCLFGAALFLSYGVWRWCGNKTAFRGMVGVLPVLFLTGPCFAEQFHFTLQAFPVAFSIWLAVAAALCLERWALEAGSIGWLIPGVLCGAWSMGTYQVMAAFQIALLVMAYFLRISGEGKEKKWFLCGLQIAGGFTLAFLLNLLLANILRVVTGEYLSYVTDQFRWEEGIRLCLHYIWNDVLRVLESREIFYHDWTLEILLVFTLLAMVRVFRSGTTTGRRWWGVVSVVCLMAAPFYLTIISGYYQPARAQLVYPLAFAFWCSYLTTVDHKWIRRAALVLCLVISVNQAQVTTGLFRTAAEVSRNDVLFMNRIYARAEEVADTENMEDVAIVLVGRTEPVFSDDCLIGDTIGYSYFNWVDEELGVTGRTFTKNGLGKVLGMKYRGAEEADCRIVESQAEGRPCWPAEDSVWKAGENLVGVKLGEMD